MRRILLAFSLTVTPTAHAQDPPIAGRPVDFSNIVGRYEIKASAAPTVVHVEESILLKIEIVGTGDTNYEPKRSSLKLIPATWESDFYIQDMPADDRVMRDAKTWLFVYRLKPKHVNVTAIPLITLHYYDPKQPEKNRFQKEYGGPIPITVTPKPDPPPDDRVDILLPESFYERAASDEVLRATPRYALDLYRMSAWLALPPLIAWIAVWAYRRSHLDRQERARRTHNEAAKRALAQLPSLAPWTVLANYLQQRFDFPASDGTPTEVAMFLKRRGFALSLCGECRAFLEACDAARFAKAGAIMNRLSHEAESLIHALEADPCARG